MYSILIYVWVIKKSLLMVKASMSCHVSQYSEIVKQLVDNKTFISVNKDHLSVDLAS